MPREQRTPSVIRVTPTAPATWEIRASLSDREAGLLAAALSVADVHKGALWDIFHGIYMGGDYPESYDHEHRRLVAKFRRGF